MRRSIRRSIATTVLAAAFAASRLKSSDHRDDDVLIGEARSGAVRVELGSAVGEVKLTEAASPGRPIVVLDAGHGGRDPGAKGVSGSTSEKELTLALARGDECQFELRVRGDEPDQLRSDVTPRADDSNPVSHTAAAFPEDCASPLATRQR